MATSTTTSTTTAVTTRDMKSKLYLSMPRIPPKVYLKTVNPHITCNLCKGYLIDATTIVECLHSFCHSCIMMHLRNDARETFCPSCEMMINKVKPNIKPDATLQAIVYKLVPGLYEKELLRRRAFYKLRPREALEATPEQRGDDTEHLIFGPNENISLMLEYSDNDSAPQNSDEENSNSSHEINSSEHCDDDFEVQLRKPKYLQCPAIFTISNLKKFLLHKFSINPNKFCVEIMYKVKSLTLPDDYTLMDVAYIFTWKRDAPMKFLYCVRAAHSPVANIEQSAVMYDLPPNRFQINSQLVCASDSTDHEQDQSSDADSEVRSERAKGPETNGSIGRTSQHEPINSTSDEPSRAPASSTSSAMKTMSSATVTSTSVASTSSKSNSSSHTSVNGSENQKKESTITKELVSSPTTSNRMDITLRIKSEPLSPSPEKPQSDRKSNGASPKPNTSKSRNSTDAKPSSPSRTNQDLKDSKEKVKTKSIILDSSATSNRSEPKTVTFSDRPSPSSATASSLSSSSSVRSSTESKQPTSSTERPKGRLLFNKEENAKSLSPPLSAENEYDFDQHLLKEEFSTKKDFFEKIHLKPRTDSPLVQLPKMPKNEQKSDTALPTNLSKDKDTNKTSAATITATATTTTSASSIRPSVSSSSNFSAALAAHIAAADAEKLAAKKQENKTSKRKSREPVKNVAKVKCASPNERTIDSKWDPTKSTISPSTLISTATSSNATSSTGSSSTSTSNSSSNNNAGDRIRRIQDPPNAMARYMSTLAQQNKNHLKSIKSNASSSTTKPNQASSSTASPSNSLSSTPLSSKPVFKTPTSSSSKESPSLGLKPTTSESGTSIIINNVQRPTQVDTPRPTMSLKPDLVGQQQSYYYTPPLNRTFMNETEILEIRNDEKVYDPTMSPMSLAKPIETSIPHLGASLGTGLLALQHFSRGQSNLSNLTPVQMSQLSQLVSLQRYSPTLSPFLHNVFNKPIKPKKQLDTKRPSGSSNLETKANSLQKTFHPPRNVADGSPADSAKQPNFCGLRIPAELHISLTNEEDEQPLRRPYNIKNSNVHNSIEILKLPQESENELNSKFPLPLPSSSSSSSSPSTTAAAASSPVDKSWQTNRNANNQTKHITNQQNNQIDSTSAKSPLDYQSATFQEKFMEMLQNPSQKPKVPPHPKLPSNRPISNMDELSRNQEAQKRKLQQQIDDKTAKVRKLQPTGPQQRSSPTTQRPVPDLLIPKDDRKVTVSNSSSSGSSSSSSSSASGSNQSQILSSGPSTLVNSKNAKDRQSPTVSSNALSVDKAATLLAVAQAKVQQVANEIPTSKYMPIQTSSTPIWANHCTAEQIASHKTLVESLTQGKKNSSTFVD